MPLPTNSILSGRANNTRLKGEVQVALAQALGVFKLRLQKDK